VQHGNQAGKENEASELFSERHVQTPDVTSLYLETGKLRAKNALAIAIRHPPALVKTFLTPE
jgi:hypothetical protein